MRLQLLTGLLGASLVVLLLYTVGFVRTEVINDILRFEVNGPYRPGKGCIWVDFNFRSWKFGLMIDYGRRRPLIDSSYPH